MLLRTSVPANSPCPISNTIHKFHGVPRITIYQKI
jgi:hypothetical protein